MEAFAEFWGQAVKIAWGLPLVITLTGAGIYLTFACRGAPLRPRALRHTWEVLRGKYSDPRDPGEISHFQALTTAVSATVGLGNIAGVAIAVGVGGPGAVFWMWMAGLVGMATEFFNCTLACLYRKEDEDGIAQGGPMYFIEVGLGRKFRLLAVMFAACGMVGALPLFQSNQLARLLEAEWSMPPLGTGVAAMLLVGIVIIGGIRRLGEATARIVPAMCILYLAAALYIIAANHAALPDVLLRIFTQAFGTDAALGGAAGLTFREVLITGVQRAAFSNEAGIGTTALAHGAARTHEPVRQGLVAMLGPFIDTNIVCTLTAFVILSSGVSLDGGGIVMTTTAFESAMPGIGRIVLSCVVILFAVSTLMSYSYYSVKCAQYLFGKNFGRHYVYVYLALIPVAAMWTQSIAVNIIDTAFAMMAVPTLTGLLLLSPRVVAALDDYFKRMALGDEH